jgi:aquaporin Z
MNRLLAEFLGTFFLVFAGTGAVVVDDLRGHPIGAVGIGLVFGMVVLTLIYTFGELSGAHFNPAVTLGFAAAGRFRWKEVPGYAASQFLGAVSASMALHGIFPENKGLGSTQPSGSPAAAVVMELLLTLFLMLVILRVSTGAREKGITAAIAVGAMIGLEAMFAGPFCGASMNPARSAGPALVSGQLQHLWVYFAAPCAGALAAVLLDRLLGPVPATARD